MDVSSDGSKRRKRSGEESAARLFDDGLIDIFTHRIGSYLTGKDFSSYLSAAIASNALRQGCDGRRSHLDTTSVGIVRCLAQRCAAFLTSVGAPGSMSGLLREGAAAAVSGRLSDLRSNMKPVSEWCAFLDYCELTPLRLSQARLRQENPVHPVWIVGAGTFGVSNSPSILSVPPQTWSPELLFLGEKWMVDCPREQPMLSQHFVFDPSDMIKNMCHTTAVLSWSDSAYLRYMHSAIDIEAGMVVYHAHPRSEAGDGTCSLNWLSRAYCDSMIGRFVRNALAKLEELKWMVEATVWDNNMLALIDISETCIPPDHMSGFGERIIKLMKEVERWYGDKEDADGVFTDSFE